MKHKFSITYNTMQTIKINRTTLSEKTIPRFQGVARFARLISEGFGEMLVLLFPIQSYSSALKSCLNDKI